MPNFPADCAWGKQRLGKVDLSYVGVSDTPTNERSATRPGGEDTFVVLGGMEIIALADCSDTACEDIDVPHVVRTGWT